MWDYQLSCVPERTVITQCDEDETDVVPHGVLQLSIWTHFPRPSARCCFIPTHVFYITLSHCAEGHNSKRRLERKRLSWWLFKAVMLIVKKTKPITPGDPSSQVLNAVMSWVVQPKGVFPKLIDRVLCIKANQVTFLEPFVLLRCWIVIIIIWILELWPEMYFVRSPWPLITKI